MLDDFAQLAGFLEIFGGRGTLAVRFCRHLNQKVNENIKEIIFLLDFG
jgi:hypothetical protein